ncbi:MAG: hypothetical protein COA78_38825 [Blastopirellula sp.]|nr:MAG: hypothetical protein COA78_38825 [Blastopirellula sp.]
MAVTEKLLELWPVGVVLVALGFRVESGRLLNRQSVEHLEQQRTADLEHHKEDMKSLHARMSGHEKRHGDMLSEIRGDIKKLLER